MNHDILPYQVLFLYILASEAVKNLIAAFQHMFPTTI